MTITSREARMAAYTLVAVWRELGCSREDVGMVTKAKDYLHTAAQRLPEHSETHEDQIVAFGEEGFV